MRKNGVPGMRILMMAVALIASGTAQAGTNLPALADHPSADCARPEKPVKPGNPSDGAEISRYNAKIAQYNKDAQVYVACVNTYVANANADMALIHARSQAASDAGNAP